jgi:hypothetical protein
MPPNAAKSRWTEASRKGNNYDLLEAEERQRDQEGGRAVAVPKVRVPSGLTDDEIQEWVDSKGGQVQFTPGNSYVKFVGDGDPQDVANELYQFSQKKKESQTLLTRRQSEPRESGSSALTKEDQELEKLTQEYMKKRGYSYEDARKEAEWFLYQR